MPYKCEIAILRLRFPTPSSAFHANPVSLAGRCNPRLPLFCGGYPMHWLRMPACLQSPSLRVRIQQRENFYHRWRMIPALIVNNDQGNHLHTVTQGANWMFQNFDFLRLDTRSSHAHVLQQAVGGTTARSKFGCIVGDFGHAAHVYRSLRLNGITFSVARCHS